MEKKEAVESGYVYEIGLWKQYLIGFGEHYPDGSYVYNDDANKKNNNVGIIISKDDCPEYFCLSDDKQTVEESNIIRLNKEQIIKIRDHLNMLINKDAHV